MSAGFNSSAPGAAVRRRAVTAALALAVVALVLSGCGSSSSGGSSSASSSSSSSGSSSGSSTANVTLNVGVLPIGDVAPLYLGVKQGFFSQQHLTINPAVFQGGAAVVPAVMSGSDQIGFSNVVSLMLAKSHNLPIKPLTPGVQGAASTAQAWDALLSPKGGATSLSQLAGQTVSVNTLKDLPEVAVRNSLAKAGVNLSSVKFVEIPFPDVPAALASKRVAAAFAVEPFVGATIAAGAQKLATPFEDLGPNLTISEYFTTAQYAAQHADVIARFKKAMDQSLTYAASHPSAVRAIIPTFTKTPAAAAAKMTLPDWSTSVNASALTALVQQAQKYGVLSGSVDTSVFTNLG